jgi:hypothetical protein
MGSLSSLNLSKNGLKGVQAGKTLGGAIAANTALKQLDISGSQGSSSRHSLEQCDAEFVRAFVVGLGDNKAITKLTFGDKQVVTMTTDMTAANFSGKLASYEALIVAAFLPKCT